MNDDIVKASAERAKAIMKASKGDMEKALTILLSGTRGAFQQMIERIDKLEASLKEKK